MGHFAVISAVAILIFIIGASFLSQPLEEFHPFTGECVRQLEATKWGFGPSRAVPCGTHGEFAVQRVPMQ